jgi:hypothetical protein
MVTVGYEYLDLESSSPDYDCHRCSWSGDDPKVLMGSCDDAFCPECGATLSD